MIKCVRISVVCLENTHEGIKNGAPEFFGFTFDVEESKKDAILDFIALRLEKMQLPLKAIYIDDALEVSKSHVWDEDKIAASFEKHEEELISEVLKQSKKTTKRR
jgi:hypothetical protein